MKSEYICTVCPNGCELSVEYEGETMISCNILLLVWNISSFSGRGMV